MNPSLARTFVVLPESGLLATSVPRKLIMPMGADEVLDFSTQWQLVLQDANDTIASLTSTVSSGITKQSEQLAGSLSTVWVNAPALGARAEILWHLVTAGGRVLDRSIVLVGVER